MSVQSAHRSFQTSDTKLTSGKESPYALIRFVFVMQRFCYMTAARGDSAGWQIGRVVGIRVRVCPVGDDVILAQIEQVGKSTIVGIGSNECA